MNKQILLDLGLSEREIAVFLVLLKLGSTTTGPLVKDSGVQNSKIYETLDKLMKKGLCNYVLKGKTKYFQASDPNTLMNFYEEKKANLSETVDELQIIRQKKEVEYDARIYEGARAIKSVFYEMYDYIGKNSEYCGLPLGELLAKEELQIFWAQVFKKRLDMKIRIRTLHNIKWKHIFKQFYSQYELIKIKYTRQEFPTGIFIFKDHLLNVIWGKKPVGFLIKSRENYVRWQRFFNEQWEKAKD
ncbi:MAG: helix-turn-helix domain-containing protein [Nanoarchaeota archaeon]|nr:helix-turn-helix domain-containing protein [Nanoarchaeota archaeon]MBU1322254.1 helix-turn-helix domain-containing protein [Nanoarchaeota archaeon]MBU1598234.1 helix-turn-helix domain-containing protein [Nanoarchaeota archaeon]MBU2441987.1 helix-turn-helix domain-containing protein [Nanoarchaeota archaeon]